MKMLEMKMDDCYWRRGAAVTKDEESAYIHRGLGYQFVREPVL